MLSRKATAPATRAPKGEVVASRLLPMLLEMLETREHIDVLDVGGGSQSTLDFFAGHHARIHFVDLYSSELLQSPPDEIEIGDAAHAFHDYLELPHDRVFDICLFWDVFHHLDPALLQALSAALKPHVNHLTLGYGFGSLYTAARAGESENEDGFRYGVLDAEHLVLQPASVQGRFHRLSQQQLTEFFPVLTIQRATLLREGRLELLLAKP